MKKVLSLMLVALMLAGGAVAEPAANPVADYLKTVLGTETYTDFEAQAAQALLDYQAQIDAMTLEVDSAISAGAPLNDLMALKTKVEQIEDDMDRYEDGLEASVRAGDLSSQSGLAFEKEIDRLDEMLDALEDRLEKFWDD